MSKSLSKIRLSAFNHQGGRCYYCGLPMWESNIAAFSVQYKITLKQAKAFQSTAEHLLARQDGGTDTASNIVAACRFCNGHRHFRKNARQPEAHQRHVRIRMTQGHWHPRSIHSSALVKGSRDGT
ncbi:MAG: HNH endonuclease [Steroidobacteraceae bacterium]